MNFPAPPAGSRATIERIENGVRIDLPPRGMFRAKGTQSVWILPLFLAVVITVGAVVETLRFGFKVLPYVLVLILWAVAAAFVLVGIQEGRSRARLTATRDGLAIEVQGPVRSPLYVWRKEEIAAVYTGLTRRDRIPYALMIAHRKGLNRLLFEGRDRKELEWLADVVRQALDLT